MVSWLIDECARADIEEIVFVTRHGKEMIADYFRPNPALENFLGAAGKHDKIPVTTPDKMKMTFVEQTEQRGLGHAILQAEAAVGGDDFFCVLLPDEIFFHPSDSAIAQLVRHAGRLKSSVIALLNVARADVTQYGIADLEAPPTADSPAKIKKLVEKPSVAAAPSTFALPGRYVLSKKIFSYLKALPVQPDREIQLTDALTALSSNEGVYGAICQAVRFDTGQVAGFVAANLFAYAYLHSERPENPRRLMEDLLRFGEQWNALPKSIS